MFAAVPVMNKLTASDNSSEVDSGRCRSSLLMITDDDCLFAINTGRHAGPWIAIWTRQLH